METPTMEEELDNMGKRIAACEQFVRNIDVVAPLAKDLTSTRLTLSIEERAETAVVSDFPPCLKMVMARTFR